MDNTSTKIENFVKKYAKVSEIPHDKKIFDMSFANSLFAMQLIIFLEKEFNLSISNTEINFDVLSTINTITDFVKSKQS